MDTLRELNSIILAIYDATLEPDRWPTVLDRIAKAVDARGAFIFEIDGAGPAQRVRAMFHTTNYESALVSNYLTLHNRQELEDQAKFAEMSRQADLVELIPDTVLAPSRDQLMQRPNAQAMAAYGIQYRAGALLNKDHYNSDRFALQFSERAGLPTGERLHFIQAVMPHVAKALNLGRRTSRTQQMNRVTFDVLDRLRVGICLVAASGAVVYKNSEFERQLDAHGAFSIGPDRHLIARNEQVRRELNSLFGSHHSHGRFGARPRKEAIVHPLEKEGMALCIEVSPLYSPTIVGDNGFRGFALFSCDTSHPYRIDTSFLADTFALTKSEETILMLLAEGLTNAEISERRDRSIETIGTQVKSLLAKTMSTNRTQLIRLATEFSPRLFVEPYVPHSGDATNSISK